MSDYVLEVVEGTHPGRQVPLDSVVDIGREPSLPLSVPDDAQISRRHARVTMQGGQVVVADLGSTNGTYVNDQPIHGLRTLRPGDRIRTGLTVVELRTSAQVRERQSAVRARPAITAVDNQVFAPVPDRELAPAPPPPAEQAAGAPGLRAQGTPAAFVPPEVVGDPGAEADYAAIARLVDTHVKQQRNVAVFAMLAAAALAVIIYFGVT
jgi:predicted component of type VI protein secretion system